MTENEIDLVDLGDAAKETKQCAPAAFLPDSTYHWGIYEGQIPPWQCPG